MQSLAELIKDKYEEHLAKQPGMLGVEVAAKLEKAMPVLQFMKDYLDANRPSLISHAADRNYLITLQDATQFSLATDIGSSGKLPKSYSVPITNES